VFVVSLERVVLVVIVEVEMELEERDDGWVMEDGLLVALEE
jgi:hypothetical protein